MIVPSKEYVQAVRKWCDETGALMIIDEAQSGVGHTGKWFAIEHFDVVPDIITTSKSLGGGIPLCGVTATREIAERAAQLGFHQSSSHTDDPFLAAVGLAHVEILERAELVDNAAKEGDYLKRRLEEFKDRYEIVGDVRGLGMMLGIEIVTDKACKTSSPQHATAISQARSGSSFGEFSKPSDTKERLPEAPALRLGCSPRARLLPFRALTIELFRYIVDISWYR